MSVTATPIFPQVVNGSITQFANADGTTAKSLYAAGTNGSAIYSILVATNSASAVDAILGIYNGSTNYPIAIVSIPITAGYLDTVPSISYLAQSQVPLQVDAFGNPFLSLQSGYSIYMAMGTTLSSPKVMNFYIQAGDF
jgi:hypothetical protein